MPKKAVYNNKMLAIYISGDDFKYLLQRQRLYVPIFIGKVQTRVGQIIITLPDQYMSELAHAYTLEHEAIETVRAEHKNLKVHYPTHEETRRRIKNG